MGEENQGACKNTSDRLQVTDEGGRVTGDNTIADFQLKAELNI